MSEARFGDHSALRRRLIVFATSGAVVASIGVLVLILRSGGPPPPDGRIVFSTPDGISIIDVDGTNLVAVQPVGGEAIYASRPVLSPDGERIAFLRHPNPAATAVGTVSTIRLDGTDLVDHGPWHWSDALGPCYGGETLAWSPDGRHLAYFADAEWPGRYAAFSVNIESGEVVMVTDNGAGVTWSPSGGELAVSTYAPRPSDSQGYSDSCRVVTLDPNGELPQREVAQGIGALWSPTGETIAFYRRSTKSILATDLFAIAVDGGGERKLVDSGELSSFLAHWSSDGRRILSSGTDGRIRVIDGESGRTTLVARGGWATDWSPDGNWIVYELTRTEGQRRIDEIWVTRADGKGEPRLLTNGADPDWSQ